MKPARVLLTDIDDTILDFARPFQMWAKSKGYAFDGCMREMTGGIPALLDISRFEADRLVTEFILESDEFAMLPPEPCAEKVLPELHRAGFEFVAITATINNTDVWRRRRQNLVSAFGFPFKEVRLTGLGECKGSALRGYDPTVWVEDNFGHAVTGAEIGHDSYVLTRGYNVDLEHPKVTRLTGWYEIADRLL